MKRLGGAILLAAFSVSAQAATVPINYGLFGNVHVAIPVGEPRHTVIFISDTTGWNARAEKLSTALSEQQDAIVFGIDLPAYVAQMITIKDACAFPSAHIQEMSDWMQRHENLKNFSYPVLVGDGAGAAFAYAVDAQAPKGAFSALLTLGWDSSERYPKIFCKGDAGEMTTLDAAAKFRIVPVATLPNPWLPQPFAPEARRDAALSTIHKLWTNTLLSFLQAMPQRPEAQPVESQLVESFAWLTAPGAEATPLPADVADLPLIEVPARGAFAQRVAIILTGDGGWQGLDIAVADQLAQRGIAVVGLSTVKFFWTTRTPAQAADAVARIIGHYASLHPSADFIVIGYSFGASLAPVVVNRVPDSARSKIAAQVLISPDAEAVFEIHVGDWFGSTHHDGALPLAPEIAQTQVPVICVHGEDEGADSFCPTIAHAPHVHDVSLPGGHHYDGDYDALGAKIAASLPPPRNAPRASQ